MKINKDTLKFIYVSAIFILVGSVDSILTILGM